MLRPLFITAFRIAAFSTLNAFGLLAGIHGWAADAPSLTAAPGPGHNIDIKPARKNQRIPTALVDGRRAWTFPAAAQEERAFFEIKDDDFKDGGHPSVVFTVDYYDQGAGGVNLVYDSLVADPTTGAAKLAGTITLTNTKTWKQAVIPVTDARFDDRCGSADFRISIGKNTGFILGGITITLGTAQPAVAWVQTPRGKLLPGTFDNSRIFPGTTHKFMIYIPKEYIPGTPACMYVSQDGFRPRFPGVLNRLIFTKQIPITVAIFIWPGSMEAPSPEQERRSNRCYEYDSLGGDYGRFILEEVVPYVEKTYNITFSKNPDDHAIGGASSGGICAFNTAWEYPDGFRRVYAASASLAAFRGGDILPLYVREFEPRPMRLYMYVGTDDMVNAGGSWNQNNHEMDRALKFAGYDYYFQELQGKHCVNYEDGFEDGMKWLWRDWPAPIKASIGSSRLQDTLLPDEPWTEAGAGYNNARGLAVDPKGEVFFLDTGANRIYKIGLDGKTEPFQNDAQHASALTFGADGMLYGVSETTGNVLAFDSAGNARVIANGIHGHDLIALHSGGLYVTEPGPAGAEKSKVWFISPAGDKKVVDTGLKGATGIAVSSDGWLLSVADGRSHWIYSYQINSDGTLSDKQHFYWLHKPDDADDSGVDGLCVERASSLVFAATRMGIQIMGTQGHAQGVISAPAQPLSTICLGGPDFNILYATCGDKVYKRKVKVKGFHAFDQPTKPLPIKL